MSTQPDWSKAPEGATHYGPEAKGWKATWCKWSPEGHLMGWLAKGDTQWDRLSDTEVNPLRIAQLVERPAEWSGEGLPPAGIDIEVMHGTYGWIGARVVGRDGEAAIVRTNDGYAGVYSHEFRAIRTPEQIAAGEREKAVEAMIVIAMAKPDWRGTCEALYDAGYRRQESA